eukprot:1620297-Rhodomonas_salina.2
MQLIPCIRRAVRIAHRSDGIGRGACSGSTIRELLVPDIAYCTYVTPQIALRCQHRASHSARVAS